jgi:hypothetical protein
VTFRSAPSSVGSAAPRCGLILRPQFRSVAALSHIGLDHNRRCVTSCIPNTVVAFHLTFHPRSDHSVLVVSTSFWRFGVLHCIGLINASSKPCFDVAARMVWVSGCIVGRSVAVASLRGVVTSDRCCVSSCNIWACVGALVRAISSGAHWTSHTRTSSSVRHHHIVHPHRALQCITSKHMLHHINVVPWTLNVVPWTLNVVPWTLNAVPWTLNVVPWTLRSLGR